MLQGIPSTIVYFDDSLVTGDTAAESLHNLDQVLERLDKAGTRLKKDKCTFGAEEFVFLGHRINRFGIKPFDEKAKALVQAKPAENIQQLKGYIASLMVADVISPTFYRTNSPTSNTTMIIL